MRKKYLLKSLIALAAALTALCIALFFRLVRVERIEVVDNDVYAFLEQAADSVKMQVSAFEPYALFVKSTENSMALSVDVKDAFTIPADIKGYLKIDGVDIFWHNDVFGSDMSEFYVGTGKKSIFVILSKYGFNRFINSNLFNLRIFDMKWAYKLIDGQWNSSGYWGVVHEQDEREFSQWRQEHSDTLDTKPLILPSFLERYDSLSQNNFNTFMADWKRWSDQLRCMSTDSTLNAVITDIMAEYPGADEENTGVFLSLPDAVEIRKYEGSYSDYTSRPDIWESTRDDEGWDYMMQASERYRYVPSVESDKEILYVTPEIDSLLSMYVGGIVSMPIKEERVESLRQMIPVILGHWGYYWYFCSMPIIYCIHLFEDGYAVCVRTSFSSGERAFCPYDPLRPKETSSWIE